MAPTAPATSSRQRFERRLLVATVLGPALSFAAAPLLATALGRDGRGTLAAVVSAFIVFRYLATLGGQEAALAAAQWPDLGVAAAARAVTRWIAPASVVFTAIAYLLAPAMFRLDGEALDVFRSVLLIIPLAAISDGLRFALTADKRSIPVVTHILAPHVVRLAGAILMVGLAIESVRFGAWISVLGSLVGFAAVVTVAAPLARRATLVPRVEQRFRRFARDLAPGQAARLGNRRLDQLLLGAVAGASALGLYAVAVALAEVADLFTRSIRQLAMRSAGDPDGPPVEQYFRMGLVLFLPALVVLALGIPVVLNVLFPSSFGKALWPAEILLLAGLANYVRDVLGVFLVTGSSARTESMVQLVTLVVGVAGVLGFGWKFGAVGASLAAVISYSIGAILVFARYRATIDGASVSNLIPRMADVRHAQDLVFNR